MASTAQEQDAWSNRSIHSPKMDTPIVEAQDLENLLNTSFNTLFEQIKIRNNVADSQQEQIKYSIIDLKKPISEQINKNRSWFNSRC